MGHLRDAGPEGQAWPQRARCHVDTAIRVRTVHPVSGVVMAGARTGVWGVCVLAAVLVACGGGGSSGGGAGGGSNPPTQPPPPANRLPQFTSAAAASVAENTAGTFHTATATDADNDALTNVHPVWRRGSRQLPRHLQRCALVRGAGGFRSAGRQQPRQRLPTRTVRQRWQGQRHPGIHGDGDQCFGRCFPRTAGGDQP